MPLRKGLFFLRKEREIVKTLDKNVNLWTEKAKILDYILFRRHVNDVEGLTGISPFLGA
jgi:hypothetical protein